MPIFWAACSKFSVVKQLSATYFLIPLLPFAIVPAYSEGSAPIFAEVLWPIYDLVLPCLCTLFETYFAYVPTPKSPKIKKINLDWKFQSRTFRIPHKNRGLVGGPLENFNLDWKFQSRRAILIFFNLWALRDLFWRIFLEGLWQWVGLFYLRVCLFYLRLVFVAYGRLAWSFLLTV